MSTSPMPGKVRRIRFVATYWIKDPGKWAEAFGRGTAHHEDASIHITRIKLKYRPHRNPRFPYFVTLGATIGDKAKAIRYMKKQREIADRASIELSTVTNCWYVTTASCGC